MMKPLRVLHISDLHERALFDGMPEARRSLLELDAEERGYVLGPAFLESLKATVGEGIDLVCFTGDLADWGHPAEYSAATTRMDQILNTVGVSRDRFFAVPGNHDVQRKVQEGAWKEIKEWYADTHDRARLGRWLRGAAEAPSGVSPESCKQIMERTAAFWDWMDSFGQSELRPRGSKPLGYRKTFPVGTFGHIAHAVSIVGLDSAWLCGADDDQGRILVLEEQVQAHIRNGASGIEGFRIALVHHPLDHLADHHEIRRLLGDNGVDILLHGHQHDPMVMLTQESGASLQIFAAGCLMEGDHGKGWPNGFQVLEIDVGSCCGAAHFRKWAPRGRFWAKGSDIYRNAPDGTLEWPLLPASTKELIQLLCERATAADRYLADLADDDGIRTIRGEFTRLHEQHVSSVRKGHAIQAHETSRQIVRLEEQLNRILEVHRKPPTSLSFSTTLGTPVDVQFEKLGQIPLNALRLYRRALERGPNRDQENNAKT